MPFVLVLRRANSRLQSVTRGIVFACGMTLATLVLPRDLVGRYVPLAVWVLLVPAIAWNVWAARSMPRIHRKSYVASLVVTALTSMVTIYVAGKAFAAHLFA